MPTLQEAIQFSQQVRSLVGTAEQLELQVNQLPNTFADKASLETAVTTMTGVLDKAVALADSLKAACRLPVNPIAPGTPPASIFAPTDGG